jgi:hypothetical protein
MKKAAILLSVFGSGLAAYGFSGLEGSLDLNTRFVPESGYSGSLFWSQNNQLEITIGVALLVWGLMLYRDSK